MRKVNKKLSSTFEQTWRQAVGVESFAAPDSTFSVAQFHSYLYAMDRHVRWSEDGVPIGMIGSEQQAGRLRLAKNFPRVGFVAVPGAGNGSRQQQTSPHRQTARGLHLARLDRVGSLQSHLSRFVQTFSWQEDVRQPVSGGGDQERVVNGLRQANGTISGHESELAVAEFLQQR